MSIILSNVNIARPIHVGASLGRWHKDFVENRKFARWGYKDKVKVSGPLPRLKNDSAVVSQMPVFRPTNPFAPSVALQGQNDYIDILGHEEMIPTRTHYHIPKWLRGFRHQTHFEAMIRKNKIFGSSGMKVAFPAKHEAMQLKLRRYWMWQRVALNQKRWTNYTGVKFGPVPNPFKTRYPF